MVNAHHKEFVELVMTIQATKTWDDMKLTNEKFARVIGAKQRSYYRWLRGETKVPLTVVLLLRMILKDFTRG